MAYKDALIAELKMEAASTRKILQCVPDGQYDWKPHQRSMKLGRLAAHVAELAGWMSMIMKTTELDFAKGEYLTPDVATTDALVAEFDKNVADSLAVLENCKDEDFDQMWSMRAGPNIFFTLPKKVVLRTFAYSHHFHHRGQLSVYLRLLDIPIPGMYGPSADEMASLEH